MPRRITPCERAVLPAHIVPMLAVQSDLPADDGRYAFEFKWDGVRAICFWDGASIRLESRNLLDVTPQYSEIASIARSLGHRPTVLDGEIIAMDSTGRISFSQLQRRMHVRDARIIAKLIEQVPVTYMIFDVLYHNGRSAMHLPYHRRRQILDGMKLAGDHWLTPPCCAGGGRTMLEAARQSAMEGVVAKQIDSPYEPGLRSGAWRKIKLIKRQEFVIGGWMPGQGAIAGMLGALLVGYYDGGRLIFAGRVGTGFSDAVRLEMQARLRAAAMSASPFATHVPYRNAIYARPELVCEVDFTEWTPDGILRHPAFKGLRSDKAAVDVVRES